MSESEQHPVNKRVLTFTILDAVTFCKGNRACIHGPNEHELLLSTFAHLGNPCGHTFCGECGWRWIKKHVSPLKRLRHCFLHMAEGGTFLCDMSGQPIP